MRTVYRRHRYGTYGTNILHPSTLKNIHPLSEGDNPLMDINTGTATSALITSLAAITTLVCGPEQLEDDEEFLRCNPFNNYRELHGSG